MGEVAVAQSAAVPDRSVVRRTSLVPPAVKGLFLVELLIGLGSVVAFEIHTRTWQSHLFTFFLLGGEENLGTWFSVVQLALVGVLLSILAGVMMVQRRPGSLLLWLGPLLFFYMSIDEGIALHEWVGGVLQRRLGLIEGEDEIRGAMTRTGYWMFLLVPVFLAGLAGVAWLTGSFWRGRRKVITLLATGFACFLFSAAGIEIIGNFIPHGTAENFVVTLEEIGEMASVTLLLWASLELLTSHGIRLVTVESDPSAPPKNSARARMRRG